MKDQLTLANINIFAILRNLEDLCELDEECRKLIDGKEITIQLSVINGPKALMEFKNGGVKIKNGVGNSHMKLYFKSPSHLNAMIDGTSNPIPIKGFKEIQFLKKEFTQLTNKLSYYLKPNEELLNDSEYFRINTVLTFYAAFMALSQIGNYDPIGKLNASRIPDGVMSIVVMNGGPSVFMEVKEGKLEVKKGIHKSPRAIMEFDSLETANELLNGKVDSYSCIAAEKVRIKGYVPMIDNFNKLLSQVSLYLK